MRSLTQSQAAVEALYALYYRVNFTERDVHDVVGLVFETETVNVFKQLYQWSIVPADDIDDEKYLLCKKFSEVRYV